MRPTLVVIPVLCLGICACKSDNPGADADNTTSDAGPRIWGNIFVDRNVYGGSCARRDYGASIMNGRVRFGLGATSGPVLTVLYPRA